MQNSNASEIISAMGTNLGPDVLAKVLQLFNDEQMALVKQMPAKQTDIEYGDHPRQKLDIYAPINSNNDLTPVVVFVHGGGFLKGDKGSDQHWQNSNVGRLAATEGFIGVVMNYRLAPDSTWPSGGEDIAAVVQWLQSNIQAYGGNPTRIILVGTSAGAVHIATYLHTQAVANAVCGCVLLSGLYGFTDLDERDTLYYGENFLYPKRMPLNAVAEVNMPLFFACAEFDPPRFREEFNGIIQKRQEIHGRLPPSTIVSGHNHYSLPAHLGTSDVQLSREIFGFIRTYC